MRGGCRISDLNESTLSISFLHANFPCSVYLIYSFVFYFVFFFFLDCFSFLKSSHWWIERCEVPTLDCQLLALWSYKCGPGIQPAGRDILVMNSKSHFSSAISKHSSAKPSHPHHTPTVTPRLSVLPTKSLSSPCVLWAPREHSLSPGPILLAFGFVLASSPPAFPTQPFWWKPPFPWKLPMDSGCLLQNFTQPVS